MFNTEELRRIWFGKTFHWSAKVRMLANYHETQKAEEPTWSELRTAYALNISQPSVWEGLRLAAMIKRFPSLAKIPKWDAVDLITAYQGKTIAELRRAVKLTTVRYKATEQYNRLKRELIKEGINPDDGEEQESDHTEKVEFSDPVAGESTKLPADFRWEKRKRKTGTLASDD